MRTNEWHDTSIAFAKPAAEQLRRPPCRSSFGANAIECTRMSSRPHWLLIASNTASSWPSTLTSSGRKSGASSARASGSTKGRAFSFRYVMATSAPSSRNALAQP